jgi:hypothetical protein
MTPNEKQLASIVRQLAGRQKQIESQHRQILDKYEEFIRACEDQPRSITQEIDSIPGRRIFYTLSARQSFTIAQDGLRAAALSFLVSQDGPFICTHYPMAIWKPNSPSTAANFGLWSPVCEWPLPTQQVPDQDAIDLSYEVVDSGSQRNFQNEAAPPIFSRPDNLIPLPVPTLFAPNSTIQFFPTYERIWFDQTPAVPTDGGQLVIGFPGYRIVNL